MDLIPNLPCYSLILLVIHYPYVNSDGVSKTCSNIGTFQQLIVVSLSTCAEECYRRRRCELFMYRKDYCALKDDLNLSVLEEKRPVCEYYTRDDLSLSDIGSCKGHTCGVTYRCHSKSDSEFECQKTECPKPIEIAGATLLSNTHTIGSTNRYNCKNDMVSHGTPTITCGEDATWSATDFQCTFVHAHAHQCPSPYHTYFNADLTWSEIDLECLQEQSCPVPDKAYINAVLTHIEGSMFLPGTNVTFTCREGFRNTGEAMTLTCLGTLKWDPDYIGCCPENSTRSINGKCFSVLNGGVIDSKRAAKDYCAGIGGELIWLSRPEKEIFNDTLTDYILVTASLQNSLAKFEYMECAAANGAVGDDSKSYREKIDEVQANNWDGPPCYWGKIWAPGQPDFVEGEDCLARSLHAEYVYHDLHDISCKFDVLLKVGVACLLNELDIL